MCLRFERRLQVARDERGVKWVKKVGIVRALDGGSLRAGLGVWKEPWYTGACGFIEGVGPALAPE